MNQKGIVSLIGGLCIFAQIGICGDKPAKTKTSKVVTIVTNSSGVATVTGIQLPEQPKITLPYQTRGTRTDMAPVFRQPEQPQKDNGCQFVPSKEMLEEYGRNSENLQGRFGPLFIGRQRQLNEEWDKAQKKFCSTNNVPTPLSITLPPKQ